MSTHALLILTAVVWVIAAVVVLVEWATAHNQRIAADLVRYAIEWDADYGSFDAHTTQALALTKDNAQPNQKEHQS